MIYVGIALNKAIKQRGIENFVRYRQYRKKHILTFCESLEESVEVERQIVVDDDFVRSVNTYNMVPGGLG